MKVILVVTDSLRRDHVGAYGNPWIHTPSLDRLAAQANVFDHAYIGSFPTVPTRRDLFLGRGDKDVPFNRWKMIDGDEVTLPERLAQVGVPSMMVTDVQNTVTRGINLYKGFTAWVCNRGQEADPCCMDAGVPLEFPVDPELIRYGADWWHQILQTRAHRRVEEDWFAPKTYSMAIEWLERNYTRPDFFLYLDTFDPHEPWDPPAWYEAMYDAGFHGRRFEAPTYGLLKSLGITARELKNIRARYAGEVSMVDASFGRLLAALERLGIKDEVLLIFTTDHGTCMGYPDDNGMLQKGHMLGADGRMMAAGKPAVQPHQWFPHYRGVCHIPLMIKLPGQSSQRRFETITQPWNITATVLDAFGVAVAPELWGQSLLPLLTGKTKAVQDAAVLGAAHGHAQVMTREWMYCTWRGQRKPALYDLEADPNTRRNVVSKHPKVVAALREHLAAYLDRQGMGEMLEQYE
jgi:arylsulfatase A-like enzyme